MPIQEMSVPTSIHFSQVTHKGLLKLDKIWEWPPKFMSWYFHPQYGDTEKGRPIKSQGLSEGNEVMEAGPLEGVDAVSYSRWVS